MKEKENKKNRLKRFWNWLWHSESIWSYVVFLALLFVIVKFIFLPGLGLIFGTSLPLAIVESSSMEHYSLKETAGYIICGQSFSKSEFFNQEEYWQTCGNWYEQNTNITKEQFQSFGFKNGFRKGDLMIVFGKKISDIKLGDIIIFNAGSAHPIIHRVISLSPELQTKGDHNPAQLSQEKSISESQVVGVAVAKIPYVGWVKLVFVELGKKLAG